MTDRNASLIRRLPGPLLAILAGVVYCVTLSDGAFPGESARIIAQYTGLMGVDTTAHPLWGYCATLIGGLPFGDLAGRLNLFSAICGALVVWLCYVLVSGAVVEILDEAEIHDDRQIAIAGIVAGLAAALFLAFAAPFWVVANRAHYAVFDLLLLFLAGVLLLIYTRTLKDWVLLLFGLLYGLGVVEFATFIVFAPLAAGYVLWALWRNEKLEWRRVLRVALCAALGLSLYLLAAWKFALTETSQITEIGGFWNALLQTLRNQYFLINQSLPKSGWLLVLMVSAVPWLVILLVCRRGLNDERDRGFYFLHLVMTLVLILVLFDSRISPWSHLGFQRLLVTPYALLALSYGYLAAYWFLLPVRWWPGTEEAWRIRFRGLLGPVFAAILLGLACVPAFRNGKVADARPAGLVNRIARETLADMQGRTWLIGDGVLDNNYLIAAHDAGRELKIVNLAQGNSDLYMRFLAAQFPDNRLKSMAQVGMLAFLQAWFGSSPDVVRNVAVLSLPDLWFAAGTAALPNRTVYLNLASNATPASAALLAGHQPFWRDILPLVQRARQAGEANPEYDGYFHYLQRHLSMVANNAGVLMEDWKSPEDAFQAYAWARECDPDNVSALLNEYVMVQNGFKPEAKQKITAAVEEEFKDPRTKVQVWSLARTYGYVRIPEMFVSMGWTWALSGQPGLAIAGMKRAVDLGLEDKAAARIKETLASVYFAQDQKDESARLYRELLARNPTNMTALIASAHVMAVRGDFKEAEKLLNRAEQAGLARERLSLEWATLFLAAGKTDRARILLQELLDIDRDDLRAWTLLGEVFFVQNDGKGMEECLAHLDKAKQLDFPALVLKGHIALRRHKLLDAQAAFDQALKWSPNNVPILEKSIQIDALMGRADLVDRQVRQLLTLDPGNAKGNYFLASLQLHRRQVALAENSLRKSLKKERSALALNDLSWILQDRKEYDEAEPLVREALALMPELPPAWDTLGVLLMRKGQFEEAEKAFNKAIGLDPTIRPIAVHLAELYCLMKKYDRANKIVDNLLSRPNEISIADRDTLQRVKKESVISHQ